MLFNTVITSQRFSNSNFHITGGMRCTDPEDLCLALYTSRSWASVFCLKREQSLRFRQAVCRAQQMRVMISYDNYDPWSHNMGRERSARSFSQGLLPDVGDSCLRISELQEQGGAGWNSFFLVTFGWLQVEGVGWGSSKGGQETQMSVDLGSLKRQKNQTHHSIQLLAVGGSDGLQDLYLRGKGQAVEVRFPGPSLRVPLLASFCSSHSRLKTLQVLETYSSYLHSLGHRILVYKIVTD